MDEGRSLSTYLQRIGRRRRASSNEPNLMEDASRRVRPRLDPPFLDPPHPVAQNPRCLAMGPTVSDLEENTGYEEHQQWHQGWDLDTTPDQQQREVPINGENLREDYSGREARRLRYHCAPEDNPSVLNINLQNPEEPRRDEESIQDEESSSEEFQEGVLLSSQPLDLSEYDMGYDNSNQEAPEGPFQEEEEEFHGELFEGQIVLEDITPLQVLPPIDPWAYSGDTDDVASNDEMISSSIQESIFVSDRHETEFCIFCQDEFQDGEEIGMLKCRHRFHSKEIAKWLCQKMWCPVCKQPVV